MSASPGMRTNALTSVMIVALLSGDGCDGYVPMRFKHLSASTSESFKDSFIIFLIIMLILFVISLIRQIYQCYRGKQSTEKYVENDGIQKNDLVGYTTAADYNTKYMPSPVEEEKKELNDENKWNLGYATAEHFNTKY